MLANWSISKRRTQRDPKRVEQQRRRIDARLPRRFRRARPDRPLDTVPRPAPAQPAGRLPVVAVFALVHGGAGTMLGLLWYGRIGVRRAVWRTRECRRRGSGKRLSFTPFPTESF